MTSEPPPPLPQYWVMKESRSRPGYRYCFNQETGECRWMLPTATLDIQDIAKQAQKAVASMTTSIPAPVPSTTTEKVPDSPAPDAIARKRTREEQPSGSNKKPKEVRVLHILKKHKDSRRPASWRRPKITDTKEKATEDLAELLEILREVQNDPKELRATFEELAKTESDCSSAKRGGDLGFFGPKKMQPAFEKASFALEIGQLSDIIETSSGVHVLLRVG